jgi:hypothetical protein
MPSLRDCRAGSADLRVKKNRKPRADALGYKYAVPNGTEIIFNYFSQTLDIARLRAYIGTCFFGHFWVLSVVV